MAWEWDEDTLSRLSGFLSEAGIMKGPVTARGIGDGHSNLTFLVEGEGGKVVVRRPPPPPLPPGANDMLREARIMSALESSEVPVPEILATAETDEVLDVPLYVMSYLSGPVVTTTMPSSIAEPEQCRQVGESIVDTLVALHAVDWREVGLGDLGRPEGFNARHVSRIRRLVTAEDGTIPAEFREVDDWLQANIPSESDARLVHADFRIGNLVLASDAPGRVDAVLDWELCTLGDPLLDVGYLVATTPTPGRSPNPIAELGLAELSEGFPTIDEMLARYAERSDRDLSNLSWYTVLALWKLAVLFEYNRGRVLDGIGDPYYGDPELVPRFLADARDVIASMS